MQQGLAPHDIIGIETNGRVALRKRLEREAGFETREVSGKAEMHLDSESQVTIGVATEIERVGLRKHLWIAVGATETEEYTLPAFESCSVRGEIVANVANQESPRPVETYQLFNGPIE